MKTHVDTKQKLLDRGNRLFKKLLTEHGGVYTDAEVAEYLGVSVDRVHECIENGRLIALEVDGQTLIPVLQFHEHEILPHLDDVLSLMETTDPVAVIRFFVTFDPDIGMTPVDALRNNTKLDVVRLRARQFGIQLAV